MDNKTKALNWWNSLSAAEKLDVAAKNELTIIQYVHATVDEVMRCYESIVSEEPLYIGSKFYVPSDESVEMNNFKFKCQHDALQIALRSENFERVIDIYPAEYKIEAFHIIEPLGLTDQKYWELLRKVWRESTHHEKYLWEWKKLFDSPRPMRQKMMNDQDLEEFKQLPNLCHIFRGYIPLKNQRGWSWSADIEIAKQSGTQISRKLVSKTKMIAYFSDTKEVIYVK